jgi:acetyl-CoA synthetase (ADP-forming)
VRRRADLLAAALRRQVHLLVAPMLRATAAHRRPADDQFGMTVMGVGGILAEALADVSFRLVPIDQVDAEEMIDDLALQALLGRFRGEPAVDRAAVADVLLGLSSAAEQRADIASADLNPLLVVDGRPVAVDALVEVR